MPVDTTKLLQDKRLVRVALWFVLNDAIHRETWEEGGGMPDLPTDGFLCGRGVFADGTGEHYGGDGWLVFGLTSKGLLCQTTGGDRPEAYRYPDCQFSRCRLAPSAVMHIANEEMKQWQ